MKSSKDSTVGRLTRLAVMALLWLVPTLVAATAPVTTVAQYNVTSRGFRIGSVTTSQLYSSEGGSTTLQFETRTTVSASFLWLGYHLDTVERGTVKDGTLVSYYRQGEENGTSITVDGRLEGQNFRFAVQEQGGRRTVTIPRSSYDSTTMELPEALLDFRGREAITLRVLDVEHLAVVRREYRLIREARYSISGRDHPCRIVDYADPNKRGRRWVQKERDAIVMYRQDGQGDQSYSVKAVSLSRRL